MVEPDWRLPGVRKDAQSITSDWEMSGLRLIDGARLREVKHVPKRDGHLVEIFRSDWRLDEGGVDQVFRIVLFPGAVNAWHGHEATTDRLFVSDGLVQVVLYDSRPASPTRGLVCELRLGELRPALLVVPPRVWHGVKNVGPRPACLLNLVDRAYRYDDPDHWRLPWDSPEVPFRFAAPGAYDPPRAESTPAAPARRERRSKR
jgi:dTDP-4-dehydrorhamnose 3,5-epimerase